MYCAVAGCILHVGGGDMTAKAITVRMRETDKALLEALAYVQSVTQVSILAAGLHLYVESLDPAIRAKVDAALAAK